MLSKKTSRILSFAMLFLVVYFNSFGITGYVFAQEKAADPTSKVGPSGLPIPRFVSLKADKVNVRKGPSTEHGVVWVFRRAGLPVEIIEEFDHWRHVRDSEGQEGWVFHSLLSGRRTALVAPWQLQQAQKTNTTGQLIAVREKPSMSGKVTANIELGTLINIVSCNGKWCKLTQAGFEGWIEKNKLWGVYENETIE